MSLHMHSLIQASIDCCMPATVLDAGGESYQQINKNGIIRATIEVCTDCSIVLRRTVKCTRKGLVKHMKFELNLKK